MNPPVLQRRRLFSFLLALIVLVSGFATAQESALRTRTPRPSLIGDNGQGSLLFIGDSLTVGTNYFGKMQSKLLDLNIWTKVIVDARTGRKASQALRIMDTKITTDTTAIVIALGTNDMISRRETWYPKWVINQVMSKSDGLPVLWVNVKFSPQGRGDWRQRATRFNRNLELAKSEWPNLYTSDWNTFFKPTSGTRFVADGVHLTVKAYKYRTSYVVNQANSFGNAIVLATTTTTTTSTTTTSSTTTIPETTTTTPTTTIAPTTT